VSEWHLEFSGAKIGVMSNSKWHLELGGGKIARIKKASWWQAFFRTAKASF
jgi:hypothetical protein